MPLRRSKGTAQTRRRKGRPVIERCVISTLQGLQRRVSPVGTRCALAIELRPAVGTASGARRAVFRNPLWVAAKPAAQLPETSCPRCAAGMASQGQVCNGYLALWVSILLRWSPHSTRPNFSVDSPHAPGSSLDNCDSSVDTSVHNSDGTVPPWWRRKAPSMDRR